MSTIDIELERSVGQYYEASDRELSRRYLADDYPSIDREYFEAALRHRYELYPHILDVAEFDKFTGQDVLEIGVGQGADHCMFAKGGANLSGIDLTEKHCKMTQMCLKAFGYDPHIVRADASSLPFADLSFDHVYSCGVLLLLQHIDTAIDEVYRVLRRGGTTTVMLYNKRSIHYWIKTMLYYGWVLGERKILGHRRLVDWYTDGIGYPRTYHYGPRDVRKIFRRFRIVEYRTDCLTPEQIPLVGLPDDPHVRRWLERHFGFFLWIRAMK